MTGKNGNQRPQERAESPLPVKKVWRYLCKLLSVLESILNVSSLLIVSNTMIDRKWMRIIITTSNILRLLCKEFPTDNKLEAMSK